MTRTAELLFDTNALVDIYRGERFMKFEIFHALPDQAEMLTQIAFAAKRHRGYPGRWMEIWSPILTVSEEFIEKNDTSVAYVEGKPVGFDAISLNKKKASLEHLWVLPEHMGRGKNPRYESWLDYVVESQVSIKLSQSTHV